MENLRINKKFCMKWMLRIQKNNEYKINENTNIEISNWSIPKKLRNLSIPVSFIGISFPHMHVPNQLAQINKSI